MNINQSSDHFLEHVVMQLLQHEAESADPPVVVLVVDERDQRLVEMRVQPISEMAALLSLSLDRKLDGKQNGGNL